MKPFTPPNLPLKSLDWLRLVPFLGGAHKELAHFDALLENIPDVGLLLSPLMMQEAVLSSRIEGTQATLEEVLRFQAEGKAPSGKYDDIQEVINYRKAVDTAFESLGELPLSGRLICDAHAILLSGARGRNKDPGNFRTGSVYIGKSGASQEQATYIPPEATQVPQLFSNLEQYIHREEQDLLVQLAIIHAQFELIHPFWDGNGRVGRLLIPLFLYYKEVIAAPCFYISEYLEKHRAEYYHHLNDISGNGDWEQWIEFFLRAITEQSRINAQKAQGIIDLKDETLLKIQRVTHSQYSPQVTNFIFANPWFDSGRFRDGANVPRTSAARLLTLLERGGLIKKIIPGKGSRPSVFVFPTLMQMIMT